jgi:hypothetical protein
MMKLLEDEQAKKDKEAAKKSKTKKAKWCLKLGLIINQPVLVDINLQIKVMIVDIAYMPLIVS